MNKWKFARAEDGRIRLILADLTIKPNSCNFSCDYCLGNEMPTWCGEDEEPTPGPGEQGCAAAQDNGAPEYREGGAFKALLDKTVDVYQSKFDTAILRVSGGEVLQIKGIVDFFKRISGYYEAIQIITNGFYLNTAMLDSLKEITNLHIHFSLDGHSLELNNCRIKNEKSQQYLMENLRNAVDRGFFVEIGSVLTYANTGGFISFLDYLLRYEGRVMVFPFPVRGDMVSEFAPDEKSISSFAEIADSFEKYKSILPPKAYFQELVSIMQNKNRRLQCHIPKCVIQYFDDGTFTPCPNGWIESIGNIHEEGIEACINNLEENKLYSLLCQKRPRLEFCKHCYTSIDILNLYFEGRIDHQELGRIPLYKGTEVKSRLALLREVLEEQ